MTQRAGRQFKGRLLFVNYHYVRDPSQYNHPGIHPLPPGEFRQQVELLAGRFHMATPQEADAFIHRQADLPGWSIAITFDDGLSDHAAVARDILDPLGLKAIFFILSRPLQDRRATAVHKVHWLRATSHPHDFRDAFLSHLPGTFRSQFEEGVSSAEAEAAYPYDTPGDAKIKFLLNFHIPLEVVDDVCSRILTDRGLEEAEFCAFTYMSEQDVRDLHDNGHLIAAHGHTHKAFARMTHQDMAAEITRCMDCLEGIIAKRPTWFSYPNGRGGMVPTGVTSMCQDLGLHVGLTLQFGWNDGSGSPLTLKRINTNELDRALAEAPNEAGALRTA